MHSNIFMYITALSAVSFHNLVNNINEATSNLDTLNSNTLERNWTLEEKDVIKSFPRCNGTRQSPINIETSKVKENLNMRLGLTAYDKPISGFLINQFPTFRLVPFSFKMPRPSSLISTSIARSFNPYADSHFTLNHIQFYWSKNDDSNSSIHNIDGENFPAELHFIHLNTAYRDFEEAFNKPDGLLIFAVMAVPSKHESYVFDKILDELTNVTNHNQKTFIEEDSTWRGLLPTDTSKFYRYQGSLTSPPCHESVQWVVFEDKLKLGQKQLKRLKRHRFTSKDIRSNAVIDWSAQRRTMQRINERIVERSFRLQLGKERNR